MYEQVENHMVMYNERDYGWDKECEEEEDLEKESGYREMHTNKFVSDEDAFEYALNTCMNSTKANYEEFQQMLVEWFYSGNWTRED